MITLSEMFSQELITVGGIYKHRDEILVKETGHEIRASRKAKGSAGAVKKAMKSESKAMKSKSIRKQVSKLTKGKTKAIKVEALKLPDSTSPEAERSKQGGAAADGEAAAAAADVASTGGPTAKKVDSALQTASTVLVMWVSALKQSRLRHYILVMSE
jgi:hypothetical protein